jgi:hypothetical protein
VNIKGVTKVPDISEIGKNIICMLEMEAHTAKIIEELKIDLSSMREIVGECNIGNSESDKEDALEDAKVY